MMYKDRNTNKYSETYTWYLTLKPLNPWNVAPGNEERTNESISNSFCLANHHSEYILKGMPPVKRRK